LAIGSLAGTGRQSATSRFVAECGLAAAQTTTKKNVPATGGIVTPGKSRSEHIFAWQDLKNNRQ
jgi:hypothetical protein